MKNQNVHRPSVDGQWSEFLNSDEFQRLTVLEGRITRQKQILSDTVSDKNRIMRRAIKRMRRANGKS